MAAQLVLAEPEREAQPCDHPQNERAIDEPDQRISEQVLCVVALVGRLHVGKHPADVGVDKTLDLADPAAARAAHSSSPARSCAPWSA